MKKVETSNKNINFCIVEDDPIFRDTFAQMLEKHGRVDQISNYDRAIQHLRHHTPDMLFIDMELNGVRNGHKIVEIASKRGIHCVVVSGHDDEELIRTCINNGAKDYFVKSDINTTLKEIISRYKKLNKEPSNAEFVFTNHPQFKQNLEFLLKNAKTEFPILLTGPTGSGKTFFAKQIHTKSELKGPFVQVNCSAIPKELFESEMFGHVKGAFSGAVSDSIGKVLEADGGTLYLDELDSMPLEQQAKLLKVIEEKEFTPVGSSKVKKSNFRLICSVQQDLTKLKADGKFREDLYYRISMIETRIPTLAERACDIVPLLKNMLLGPRRYYFSPDFKKYIESYTWPGNLRELQIFASNIELAGESNLTERLATSIQNKKNQPIEFFTQYQKEEIERIGIDQFLALVKQEAYKTFYELNEKNVKKTSQALNVDISTFYRFWRQYEPQA